MILTSYVNSLIENIDKKKCPEEIDLVLDGGAFNGIYMLGALFYLKALEEKKIIKINRISGTSIGAAFGLFYKLNKLDVILEFSKKSYEILRKNQDLKKIKLWFDKQMDIHLTNEFLECVNNKLYITYFDTHKKKQIVKKKYKTINEIKDTVFKTTHFPYLIDRVFTDKEGCMDGAFPYIFKQKSNSKKKILFINLQSIDKFINMIYIKKEKNIFTRVFKGLMDIHEFFNNNKPTKMCSYVNEWGIIDILLFRLREIVYTIVFYIFTLGLQIESIIPENLKREQIIIKCVSIFKNIWRDLLIYLTI